jgi:hypothetical protein
MEGNADALNALAHAEELFRAIEGAERIILSTIERECQALRSGQMLAAAALRTRLRDGSRLYLSAIRAARASVGALEEMLPGICEALEQQREAFAAHLKVDLAALAMERQVAGAGQRDFTTAERGLRVVAGEDQRGDRPRSHAAVRRFSVVGGSGDPQPPLRGRRAG